MCEAPLVIDLFCGLGGWAEGFLAEGYRVIGFDNAHTAPYAAGLRYTGQLVLQDVLTLHGSQFRDAAVIVASPPCQNYSYLAMPWSRSKSEHSQKAKALRRKWETEGPDNRLFDACFRIQREAIDATGGAGATYRHIPLIVENVRGAVPWVGKRDMPLADWLKLTQSEKIERGRPNATFGSFYLWGDVESVGGRVVMRPEFGHGIAAARLRKVANIQTAGAQSNQRNSVKPEARRGATSLRKKPNRAKLQTPNPTIPYSAFRG